MASPFVPVPVPMGRALSGGRTKLRRPQRASSLGSVSSCLEDPGKGLDSQRQSRCIDRGGRSQTPPPLLSPVTRARVNGTLEASVEFSSCPRSISDPSGSQQDHERPITPTVLGYEVMEERAKFTVYKVLVRKTPDESWVVFRRYADFSRINDKLKEMFPGFRLALPPKRWFKDNYDSDFLEDRLLGLQAFLQNLVAHKDISNSMAVREFLCLDDPPGPFDSLEESRWEGVMEVFGKLVKGELRQQLMSYAEEFNVDLMHQRDQKAFCETLEESNYRLQKELVEKQREITSLKRRLEEREQAIQLLEKHINGDCVSPGSPFGLSTQGSESSADAEVESSAAEADQDMTGDTGSEVQLVRSSACWCRPSLSASPPVIQVTQLYQQKLEH